MVEAVNGGRPVVSAYSTPPSAYRSLRRVSGLPVKCSGARNPAVPIGSGGRLSGDGLKIFATPKSAILTVPSLAMSTFDGLRLRCRMLRWWPCLSARAAWTATAITSSRQFSPGSSGFLGRALSRVAASVPSTNSVAYHAEPPGSTPAS